ncbi:ABC transporter substrate-binding protein [Rothia sp. AR01]|uniref:ABC transporter substrate-binding protein n=1 Tax=Rothia santali TaxID=2949643 RepID=A0A9X2HGY5_9MICC|nr:ABC transporter substrate-binding protein [Rothia santali]MCP3424668.1 ABC transporter substrate-binding protein [Rothia santali]
MKTRPLIAVASLAALTLAGCSAQGGSSTDDSAAAESSGATTLRYAAVGAPAATTDDPHGRVSNESDYLRFAMLYDVLTVTGPDGTAQPRLATSWEPVDGDLSRWRIQLRDDATFSDGSPVTADDVLFSLNRIQGKGAENNGRLSMFDLGASSATSEHELELVTAQPYAEVGAALSSLTFVVPEGSEDFAGAEVPGSGPFALDAADDTTATLHRNDDWWGGEPGVAELQITAMPDPSARASAVASGQADVAGSIAPATAQQYEDSDGFEVVRRAGAVNYPLVMDTAAEPFEHPEVRRAVKLALDRQALVDTVFLGYGETEADVLGAKDPFAPDLAPVERDVDGARQLLDDAGFPDGVELTLHSTGSYPGMEETATLAAAQLEEAGFRVTVETDPPDTYWKKVWNVEPFYLNSLGGNGFVDFARMALVPDGPINETGWTDPAFAERFDEALATGDETERHEILAGLQREVAQDGGYAVWGLGDGLDLTSDAVENVPTGTGFSRLQIERIEVAGG